MKTEHSKLRLALAVFSGLVLVESAHAANIVLNPGFETGSFTSWTQIDNTAGSGVTGALCPAGAVMVCTPHTGSFAAFFTDHNGFEGITQSLTTVAATNYNLDFWLLINPNASSVLSEYKISWDAIVLADVTNAPGAPWQHLFFTPTAAGPTTVLKFEFSDAFDWIGLDDVNVAAVAAPGGVPEPVSSGLVGASLIALVGLRRFLRLS